MCLLLAACYAWPYKKKTRSVTFFKITITQNSNTDFQNGQIFQHTDAISEILKYLLNMNWTVRLIKTHGFMIYLNWILEPIKGILFLTIAQMRSVIYSCLSLSASLFVAFL